ncbi:uncharacterized protein LOC142985254 isoform X2 [Anticarsia gemmatalis]|uniref:uncharacterized protein LOC142985254 isoform X2 n=1 Tax=Anticarsia gemmatalis TaxID=129554 RepID=UPI003F766E7C
MAASDVTIAQDGSGNVKLHPYLITLVRWCVSCLWSTASVLLHRLVTTPLPPITASKPVLKPSPKPRQAGTDHLHPEPKVECVVLHTPETPTLDVIFVHGLYGSLGNTWRQGDWRSKYKIDPTKIPLREHSSRTCNCIKYNLNYEYDTQITNTVSFKQINGCFKKILPNENSLITEKFYNNLFENNGNYETQGDFVSQLFKSDCEVNKCGLNKCFCVEKVNGQCRFNDKCKQNDKCQQNPCICKINDKCKQNDKCQENQCLYKLNGECKLNGKSQQNRYICENNDICKQNKCQHNQCLCKSNDNCQQSSFCVTNDKCKHKDKCQQSCFCKINEKSILNDSVKCDTGCGCVCDECYSSCWPRDWIKEDFPGARVISINYTSDPYLWRPLWVKENKRLRLHERADQMMEQLLKLGVGDRPIIWVGHSKGGLFIKQIYCEAYEAHIKLNKNDSQKINNIQKDQSNNIEISKLNNNINDKNNITYENESLKEENSFNENKYRKNKENNNVDNFKSKDKNFNILKYTEHENTEICGCDENDVTFNEKEDKYSSIDINMFNGEENNCIDIENERNENEGSSGFKDTRVLQTRSSLWRQSAGFMFYSVPHRGSPLADIKTPITARSIELLEISKDCQLVLELQSRWLVASKSQQPVVRSLVETCRTLMSVLWLRIVSVDSADAGIGSLHGVSVDHREICKPSSRRCLLYTELTGLIHSALNKCQCQNENK